MEDAEIISIDSKGRIHLTLTVALVVGFLGLFGVNIFNTISASDVGTSNVVNEATKESLEKVEKKVEVNTNLIAAHTATLVGIDKDVEHILKTCDRLEKAGDKYREQQTAQTRLIGELVLEIRKWKPTPKGP